MNEIIDWDHFQEMNDVEIIDFFEEVRKRLNYHKYQMAEILQITTHSYYVKTSKNIEKYKFSDREKVLIWYVAAYGPPVGFKPSVTSTVKKITPSFKKLQPAQ